MAIVIEDGTGKPDATSFVTLQALKDYAAMRGIVLPATDPEIEVLLIKAMDYLADFEPRMTGVRLTDEQALFWPRRPDPEQTPPPSWQGTVPQSWKSLQLKLAIYAQSGALIVAERPDDRGAVKAVTVGPIKTEYAGVASGASGSQPRFRDVESLLSPWLTSAIGATTAVAMRG